MASIGASWTAVRALATCGLLVPLLTPVTAENAISRADWTPLIGTAPTWYSPEIHQSAVLAGRLGFLYDVEQRQMVPANVLGMSFLFIRPGALMIGTDPGGSDELITCTMGFVLGMPGSYAITTAGHCTQLGWDVVIIAAPSLVTAIGTATVVHDGGIGDDFAIVSIAPGWQNAVDPNVAGTLGPEGPHYTEPITTANPVLVKYVGHGWGVGTGGTARAGISRMENNDQSAFWCTCPIMIGDSGGPVLAITSAHPLGQALGILTHMQYGTPAGSTAAGTHIRVIALSSAQGDLIPTSNLCPPPPPPPPTGVLLSVCGDTGHAHFSASSALLTCQDVETEWTCFAAHSRAVTLMDQDGCAAAGELAACSTDHVPASDTLMILFEPYVNIPPEGRTVVISHFLCLSETTSVECASGDEALFLPGRPPPHRPIPTTWGLRLRAG